MRWTVAQAADALGVAAPALPGPLARLAGVSIDSRTVGPGELFIAIRGPRHDGHDFVSAALARGAAAAVVESTRTAQYPAGARARLLPVENTLRSLQELARKYCDSWRGARPGRRLAGITGSTGKTTTKEMLAAILAARLRILKSEGNLNNEYGLPLTLLRLTDDHDAAVVEMGMSSRGEIARLAQIARPSLGIVTNVAPVHLEFFSSVDEIALAKRELIEGLQGSGPVAVLNEDDPRVRRFAEVFRGRVHTFGFSERAEFRAGNAHGRGLEGSDFDLRSPAGAAHFRLSLAGRHNVLNALAALAAASEWNIEAAAAQSALANLRPTALRGEILRFAEGFTLINDCYNSNPVALEKMTDLLCSTPGYQRRILIAGAFREIGPSSPDLHRAAGEYAARTNAIDWIIGVDGDAKDLVRGAIAAGHPPERTAFFDSSAQAAAFLAEFVRAGDLLLVKGSRGVRMESIAAALRDTFAPAPEPPDAASARQDGSC